MSDRRLAKLTLPELAFNQLYIKPSPAEDGNYSFTSYQAPWT
ncbi:MAG: hypothetical protein QF588_00935 [Candidatus Poseidoniaceae archaeon]|nr:hypothetical protein [Candidatus Poseidoniaceae archaeon]